MSSFLKEGDGGCLGVATDVKMVTFIQVGSDKGSRPCLRSNVLLKRSDLISEQQEKEKGRKSVALKLTLADSITSQRPSKQERATLGRRCRLLRQRPAARGADCLLACTAPGRSW